MKKDLLEKLIKWPKNYITGTDLSIVLDKSYDSRHAIIRRANEEGTLIRLRNDVYLITQSLRQQLPNTFELAQLIWGPSYISFESALSHHGWIPEAVHVISSACSKKGKTVTTPIGVFSYEHIPVDAFAMGLHHDQNESVSFMIAQPWKAVSDLIYTRRKSWKNLTQFSEDLRVEWDTLNNSNLELLLYLSKNYPSSRTCKILNQFYGELQTS